MARAPFGLGLPGWEADREWLVLETKAPPRQTKAEWGTRSFVLLRRAVITDGISDPATQRVGPIVPSMLRLRVVASLLNNLIVGGAGSFPSAIGVAYIGAAKRAVMPLVGRRRLGTWERAPLVVGGTALGAGRRR